MRAWVVRSDGEPRDVFELEDVTEPGAEQLDGLKMDLAGWVTDPAAFGIDDPAEHELFATRRTAAAARPPYEDWVLLRVAVAALGLPDVTMARGTYPVRVARPYVSGQEAVGEVIGVPPHRRDLLGRRVVAVTMQPWGSLAPVSIGVGPVFEVPNRMDDTDAAGFVIPAHTGYHAAIRRGGVRAGETVVVLGAGGGLGSAMVQLAAAQGATVVAVVGSEEKAAFATSLGAHHVAIHTGDDVATAVRAVIGSRPVDVVLDPVQGTMGPQSRALLRPDGRWVLCGHAGTLRPIDPSFYMQNLTLVGATLGGYDRDTMRAIEQETQDAVVQLWKEGRFKSVTTRAIPFDEVPDALTAMSQRETIGRVVVRVAQS
jgi:NADPH2:quinone reductase